MPFLVVFLLLIPFSCIAVNSLDLQRDAFLQAEKAIELNQRTKAQQYMQTLESYPLYPYLLSKKYIQSIQADRRANRNTVTVHELITFSNKYPDFPNLKRVWYHWLKYQAKQKHWGNFKKGYDFIQADFRSTSLVCSKYYADYQINQNASELENALPLWRVGYSQARSCDPLFKVMRQKGIITRHEVFERIELAAWKRNFKLMEYLKTRLPRSSQNDISTWIKALQNANVLLTPALYRLENKQLQEKIITTSLHYHLKRNRQGAISIFDQLNLKGKISEEIYQDIIKKIAFSYLIKRDDEAISWFKKIPPKYHSDTNIEWAIRNFLQNQEWISVLTWIHLLPQEKQDLADWQYWKAYSLYKVGRKKYGMDIMQNLAGKRNYYGFLASEFLNRPHQLQYYPLHLDKRLFTLVKQQPAFERVRELEALNRMSDMRREWFYLLNKQTEQEKIALSQIARSNGWHDLAIMSLTKTQYKDDVYLRFPLAYSEDILNHAYSQSLDPAYVFALARQESAFHLKATSPVGAMGLMQIMPSTAKYVAKKNQIPYKSKYELYNPDKNILLGTTYLKNLTESFDGNLVLAAASYNAGPNRIKQWLPKYDMEAQIWIETIPFVETRNYVKNVFTYMSIYKSIMGQPFKMSSVMAPIQRDTNQLSTN